MDRLLTDKVLAHILSEHSAQIELGVYVPAARAIAEAQHKEDASQAIATVRETAALVRAEERKALAELIRQYPTVSTTSKSGSCYSFDVPVKIVEALERGEAPAGWPEKEG